MHSVTLPRREPDGCFLIDKKLYGLKLIKLDRVLNKISSFKVRKFYQEVKYFLQNLALST